jgi:hypothetical protein
MMRCQQFLQAFVKRLMVVHNLVRIICGKETLSGQRGAVQLV